MLSGAPRQDISRKPIVFKPHFGPSKTSKCAHIVAYNIELKNRITAPWKLSRWRPLFKQGRIHAGCTLLEGRKAKASPTNQRTDRRTETPSYRDARTHLKNTYGFPLPHYQYDCTFWVYICIQHGFYEYTKKCDDKGNFLNLGSIRFFKLILDIFNKSCI